MKKRGAAGAPFLSTQRCGCQRADAAPRSSAQRPSTHDAPGSGTKAQLEAPAGLAGGCASTADRRSSRSRNAAWSVAFVDHANQRCGPPHAFWPRGSVRHWLSWSHAALPIARSMAFTDGSASASGVAHALNACASATAANNIQDMRRRRLVRATWYAPRALAAKVSIHRLSVKRDSSIDAAARAQPAMSALFGVCGREVTPTEMTLTLQPADGSAPQVFHLHKGRTVKLIRCL